MKKITLLALRLGRSPVRRDLNSLGHLHREFIWTSAPIVAPV